MYKQANLEYAAYRPCHLPFTLSEAVIVIVKEDPTLPVPPHSPSPL